MKRSVRLFVALSILLSGLLLLPFVGLSKQAFGWQQYTTTYQDTVEIQRAQYDTSRQQLTVQATSTDSSAVLSVYVTSTGEFIGTLRNMGGGSYRGRLSWPTNPESITVQSSLGGSATATVRAR